MSTQIGYNGSTTNMSGVQFIAGKFTASASGAVTSLFVKINQSTSSTRHYQVGIYNDNAGTVGTLVASSASSFTLSAVQDIYVQISMDSASLTNGNIYWLVCEVDDATSVAFDWTNTGTNQYASKGTISFPLWSDNPTGLSYVNGRTPAIYGNIVANTVTQSINSDAIIARIGLQESINSDAKIKVLGVQHSILSDAMITNSIQHSILSDATIIVPQKQESILSDAFIIHETQQFILSDAKVKRTNVQSILSDAKVVIQVLSNINNKVNVVKQTISNIAHKINTVFSNLSDVSHLISVVKDNIYNIVNDVRTHVLNISNMAHDVRVLLPIQISGNAGLQSLGKTYIHIYFNGIEQTDADINSGEIHKILNGSHNLSLDLARAYDVNIPTTETIVTVYYNTWLLYKGKITEVNPAESPEKINVICNDKFWDDDRTPHFFLVGHEPLENVAPNNELYYPTIQSALLAEFSINVGIGNFVPQTIDLFGSSTSDSITQLIEQSGNYAWYRDIDDSFKLWAAGQGSVINLERQKLGQNINLYNVLNHTFKSDATNVVNKYRVQMGDLIQTGGRQRVAHYYSSYAQYAMPAWDESLPYLSSAEGVESWANHSSESSDDFKDVFKKWSLPYLNTKLGSYTDRYPPYIILSSPSGDYDTTELLEVESVLTEGFSIDYENQIVTFNDPQFLYRTDAVGEIYSIRPPIVKVFIWKDNIVTYSDNPIPNPLFFYTDKVGNYPITIEKELSLSDLSINTFGIPYKFYGGRSETVPPWDDTDFAKDMAYWELSKTKEVHITGTIEIALDCLCFYGIDLTKRIFIDGITVAPMNIMSIDINLNNFICTLQLENSQPYTRTISLPSHGE